MKCPFCDNADTRVIDSRPTDEGQVIRRRRACDSCKKRFTTYEKVEEIMFMVVKKDGTFYNGMIFSGDYKIILNRGNYVPLDTLDMKIKPGKNYQVFEVNPYLRIIEPEISVIGRKVVAKFKLEQVTSNEVYRISLFAHSHIDVSNKLNIVNRTEELNRSITDGEAFELSINLEDYTSTLVPGKSYYFRIGAQSHGSETKYNYSASVQLDI